MEGLIKALDAAIWELGEAFAGMPEKDLWVRPHRNLLSVGELGAHIAYGEASCFLGPTFESPLFAEQIRYFPYTLETPFSVKMTPAEVYAEIQRVHEACKAAYNLTPRAYDDPHPHREGWTWGYVLVYHGFHIAYHTGQIYSVRHILGHETTDN